MTTAPVEKTYYKRPVKDWFKPGIRMTWLTYCGRRESKSIYGGYEWFCKNCDYSTGVTELPPSSCLNCGASHVACSISHHYIEVVVETTDYGFKFVSFKEKN